MAGAIMPVFLAGTIGIKRKLVNASGAVICAWICLMPTNTARLATSTDIITRKYHLMTGQITLFSGYVFFAARAQNAKQVRCHSRARQIAWMKCIFHEVGALDSIFDNFAWPAAPLSCQAPWCIDALVCSPLCAACPDGCINCGPTAPSRTTERSRVLALFAPGARVKSFGLEKRG